MSAPDAAPPPPARTGAFALAPAADGRLAARGPLVFATARQARELGMRAIDAAAGRLEIDCGAVGPSDSAGLAVLLDWLAVAKTRGRSLRLVSLPEGLAALARISDVDQLLARGV